MIITTDGTYFLKPNVQGVASSRLILYVSGTIGTAILKLQYEDLFGNFIDLTDGTILLDTQTTVDGGAGASIFLNVSSADGATNLAVETRGISS